MQKILFTAVLGFAITACTPAPPAGTGASARVAKGTATLTIQGAAAPAPSPFVPAALSLAGGVTIDSAKIVVKEVNFKGWDGFDDDEGDDDGEQESAGDDTAETSPAYARTAEDIEDGEDAEGAEDDDEDPALEAEEIDFKGPFIIDLLTGVSTPSLTQATLPEGNYSQVEFKLDSIETEAEDGAGEAAAAGMTGSSVEIAGRIVIDGVEHAFKLLDYRDEELKWSFAQPVSISSAQVNDLVLSIPLDGWVNAAMVQGMVDAFHAGDVTGGTDGVLVFSTDVGNIADLLDKNITSAGEVEHDDDGEDGE